MLLLFAGYAHDARGGWNDFIKVVGSLEELEIREERRDYKVYATRDTPEHIVDQFIYHMNVTDDGTEYEWWHVVDTDTMAIIAEGYRDGAKMDFVTAAH